MKYLKDNKNINYFKIFFILFLMFQFSSMSIYAEKIKNYEVSIQINKNGTLTINETIDYDFGDKLDKHGINHTYNNNFFQFNYSCIFSFKEGFFSEFAVFNVYNVCSGYSFWSFDRNGGISYYAGNLHYV